MRKILTLWTALICSVASFGQGSNQKGADKATANMGYNEHRARKDIESGVIYLLLPGGIVGSPVFANDTVFEHKYKLQYVSRGCIRYPGDNEAAYNKMIFTFLDRKYGNLWRREVREDVIGLK